MAVFHGALRSHVLEMDTGLSVILPYDRPQEGQRAPCRVLYLLHGLGENHTAWTRYTGIERYAREYGVAVIMPEVQRSFYCDMAMGMRYFTYITRELPGLCRELFHISSLREDTCVAGLSMGGYGAMKCALACPEQYAGAASFSGLCDIHYVMEHYEMTDEIRPMFQALFGQSLKVREKDDLFSLAAALGQKPRAEFPTLLLTCGRQDFLYDQNVRFRKCLEAQNIPVRFHEEDGDHEWGFWDRSVQMALSFFFGDA